MERDDLPGPATLDTATAARALAGMLLAQADRLASDDLATVATAMTAVRTPARALAESLEERGWSHGGLLVGLDEALDEDDLDDLDDEELADDLDEERDDELDEDLDDEPVHWDVPVGTKLTYQARYDVVVTDPEALVDHVVRRLAEAGQQVSREEVVEEDPFGTLMRLDSVAERDLEGTGLELAGAQWAVREVATTLWELDPDARDDQFPVPGA